MSDSIFSVNLDEAIGGGQLHKSYLTLSHTPALCRRLSGNVQTLLRAMLSYAQHSRITPSISPVDPKTFAPGQPAGSQFQLCCRVILSRRSHFLPKLSTLLDLIGDLRKRSAGRLLTAGTRLSAA
jgi:hypothetical protein